MDPTVTAALVNSLLGLISGLFGGYVAGRAQIRYQQRAIATTEMRRLMLEARQAFHNWIVRPAYTKGPGDYRRGSQVGAKIDALTLYFKAHEDWLDGKARASAEQIASTFGAYYVAHMHACSNKALLKEQHETAFAAETWLLQEFPGLMANVRSLPWWGRIFGG